eukprot:TRINITY_DN12360_c0_g1_i1.p1 TRINITY_DN12360_c0_g1~~TRINITY_DN12360_c0_g1_i1.p1  ORF type:complete len:160 (-),score=20.96 TRINITY_DN12360_c0_g1_i1:380-859(-)
MEEKHFCFCSIYYNHIPLAHYSKQVGTFPSFCENLIKLGIVDGFNSTCFAINNYRINITNKGHLTVLVVSSTNSKTDVALLLAEEVYVLFNSEYQHLVNHFVSSGTYPYPYEFNNLFAPFIKHTMERYNTEYHHYTGFLPPTEDVILFPSLHRSNFDRF